MGKKRLIYVSSPYTGAVVEGQVYELLEYYKQQDWFEDVLLLQSFEGSTDKQKASKILEKFSFRCKFFWQNPYYPHLFRKSISSMQEVMDGEVKDNTVFHVRGGSRAYYVRSALPEVYNHLLILDEFRGLSSNELAYAKAGSFVERCKTRIRNYQINKCNRLMQKDEHIVYTAVSPLLRQMESSEEGFDINKISVHPNIAASYFKYDPNKRKSIRKDLGLSDDQILVVTSSGESGAWQKDLDIIDALTGKGYYVLNLSKKPIDKPNVISRFVPHKEMPAYLSASDAALLWRDDVPLNHVASPSKFSEFAVMGLYVIHNKTVDIATRFIKDNNCGQLVNNPSEIVLDGSLFTDQERQQRCDAGYNMFSIDYIAKSYCKILTER